MQRFSPSQLQHYLSQARDNSHVLLDVREKWEFDICRIKDSVNVPLSVLQHQYQTLDPTLETIVICHHGIRSLRAALFLQHQGFESVINLDGGVDAWADNIDPMMDKY